MKDSLEMWLVMWFFGLSIGLIAGVLFMKIIFRL